MVLTVGRVYDRVRKLSEKELRYEEVKTPAGIVWYRQQWWCRTR